MSFEKFSNWELRSFVIGITIRLQDDRTLSAEEREHLEKHRQDLHNEWLKRTGVEKRQ